MEVWLDKEESITIGEVRIVNFGRKDRKQCLPGRGNLHLGFEAPKHIPILRKELMDEDKDVA